MSTSSRQAADPERERLIESHLPLVRAIAKRFAGRGEALEDLVQVGSLGLIRASDRFDPERGVAFATFAAPAIEGEIRRHLGDRTTAMRIPRELQRMTGQLQRRRAELRTSLGREPSVDELAAALGAEREDVERAIEAARARDPGSGPPMLDDVAGDNEFGPTSDDRLLLERGARVLDERERRIVFLRFHADMTERDIASEIGVSQAHVSRLLAGALAKLRKELEETDPPSGGPDGTASHEKAELTAAGAPDGTDGLPKQPAGKPKRGSGPSGRFLVRMPSTLHQELSEAAEREQVSLNRYVNNTLAAAVTEPESGAVDRIGNADGDAGSSSLPQRRSFRMLLAANVIVMVVAGVAAVVLLILALQQGL